MAANGIVNLWSKDVAGGYLFSPELSKLLRTKMQPMVRFRQFCEPENASEQCKHAGDNFSWDVFSDVAAEGGVLTEANTMPETSYDVTQGSVTVVEMGNSIPYSGKLDDLSRYPVSRIINKTLKNDSVKAMERGAHTQFDATLLCVGPDGGTSATEVEWSVTGAAGLSVDNNVHALASAHVKKIVDEMKERDIPAYDGTNYMCCGRPKTFRAFKDELEAKHMYVDMGFGMILNGEVGRSYEGVRFFEQTAISSEGWDEGLSDACYFFGEDTVTEAIVIPEEIRGKIPTDYGRSKGIAWYSIGGFAIVHNETGAAENRIVKWASKETP